VVPTQSWSPPVPKLKKSSSIPWTRECEELKSLLMIVTKHTD
jgi:hypothetical protein